MLLEPLDLAMLIFSPFNLYRFVSNLLTAPYIYLALPFQATVFCKYVYTGSALETVLEAAA